jgi:hypothetical protein
MSELKRSIAIYGTWKNGQSARGMIYDRGTLVDSFPEYSSYLWYEANLEDITKILIRIGSAEEPDSPAARFFRIIQERCENKLWEWYPNYIDPYRFIYVCL